ncbi:sulfurtransferase TusA family protein [Cellulomonas sp. H30R-01]|uniref:sulfurtransferase TusA family protein n=1 Tax=Cellulomonas sp. H30R-01 TaxID=2704467 RepID=UPI00138C29AF|nr:sulfurtransferase TusA family protein [Cellulomonas sp. H30R-01]QHT55993.1 sulfurtransferase TusA family protein [Cellulomonas sp. H30R-01]
MTGGPVPLVVDARGLRCPAPVIALAKAARTAAPGSELTVLATDPAARHDVPAWARMRGHTMVSSTDDEGVWRLTVRLGDAPVA